MPQTYHEDRGLVLILAVPSVLCRILSPSDIPSNTLDWHRKPSILDLPVQSTICHPTANTVLPPGTAEIDLK